VPQVLRKDAYTKISIYLSSVRVTSLLVVGVGAGFGAAKTDVTVRERKKIAMLE